MKIGEVISVKEVSEAYNALYRKTPNYIDRLDKSSKIYIFSTCQVKKKDFPDMEIVKSPSEADVCIVPVAYPYLRNAWKLLRGEVTIVDPKNIKCLKRIFEAEEVNNSKAAIREIYVDTRFSTGKVMSQEDYLKLADYMKSSDKSILNLGISLMFGFDTILNEEKMILLIAQIKYTNYLRKVKRFRLFKLQLKTKYPGLR